MTPDDITDMADIPDADQAAEATAAMLEQLLTHKLVDATREDAREAIVDLLATPEPFEQIVDLARLQPTRWAAWAMKVKNTQATAADVGDLTSAVRRRLKEVEKELAAIRIAKPGEQETYDAPDCVPDGWKAPAGWSVRPSGVWREEDDKAEHVASRPIWVIGYLQDVDSGGFSVQLAWEQVNRTIGTAILPSETVSDARGLIAAARSGLPVTSANANKLTAFIAAATTANRDRIQFARVVRRFGWVGVTGFMLGADYLTSGKADVLLGQDIDIQDTAERYAPKGTWEGWLETISPALDRPMMMLAIYNAVASVLIEPLELGDNWAIDRSGNEGRGKSTVGRVAYSVWADPQRRPTWGVTRSAFESMADMLRHLPISLDDTKNCKDKDLLPQVVYMHSNGHGGGRATPGAGARALGMRATGQWRSTLDSDGEQSLTSFSQDAGARARVLCMIGEPMPSADVANALVAGAQEHYGHLGRRVIEHLLIPGNLDRWRAAWPRCREWADRRLAEASKAARRIGRVVAALDLARCICEEVGLPAPTSEQHPMDYAVECARQGGEEADRPAEALRAVYSLAAVHTESFWNDHDRGSNGRPSKGEWLGRWDFPEANPDGWKEISITVKAVKAHLDSLKFDADIPRRWKERGWLKILREDACFRQVRIGRPSRRISVYTFPREVIDLVVGNDDEDSRESTAA